MSAIAPSLDTASPVPTPAGSAAIRLAGLTKRFPVRRTWLAALRNPLQRQWAPALQAVTCTIEDGEFFGLLGPNGAGKTTAISAVCNLIRITSGEALVFGEPATTLRARRSIGLAEQDINLDRFLTVEETLVYHGGYFGMSGDEARERAAEMIDIFDLGAKAGVRAPKLSGGQRRRLLLARALMHRPRLVILDEPTAGVDVELRLELWHYVQRINLEGTTILLTTHYIEEAEQLCDRIAFINEGRIVAQGSSAELAASYGVSSLEDAYLGLVGRKELSRARVPLEEGAA